MTKRIIFMKLIILLMKYSETMVSENNYKKKYQKIFQKKNNYKSKC